MVKFRINNKIRTKFVLIKFKIDLDLKREKKCGSYF